MWWFMLMNSGREVRQLADSSLSFFSGFVTGAIFGGNLWLRERKRDRESSIFICSWFFTREKYHFALQSRFGCGGMGSTIPQGKNYLPLFSQSSNLGEFFFPCISKSETVCSPPNFDNTVLDRALATPFCISLVKYVCRRSYSFSPSPSLYARVRVLSPKILFSPTLAAKIPPFCLLARDREIRQGVREGVKTTLG